MYQSGDILKNIYSVLGMTAKAWEIDLEKKKKKKNGEETSKRD